MKSDDSEKSLFGAIPTEEWGTGSGGWTAIVDVATGEQIGSVALALDSDVEQAGKIAAAAQLTWAAAPFRSRIAVIERARSALEAMRGDLQALMIRETGALRTKANHEIDKTIDELRSAAGLPDQPYGELLPHDEPSVLSMARRVPVGVIGVIAPWNAPLMLAMRSIAPAIALGNAVILKPDVKTALSGGSVIAQIFREAGLPDGIFQVVVGGPDIGEALVRSPHTDMISFTGSSAAGRRVGEVAGGLLKRVVLELGGNNAFIVFEDADLDNALIHAQRGTFAHQGQICMATGRHLVHESIADEYVRRLTAYAKSLKIGNPTSTRVTMGPLIDERQARRVQAVVDDAVAGGATITTGGRYEGPFYQPTVLDGVDEANAAFQAEIFGPVAPITRFSTDEEAIRLAGASNYGLSAAIHTRDVSRALAIAARLRTGMVHINGQTINDSAHIPMGGMGQSGNGGRYGGHWNLDEFTYWQWVTSRPSPPSAPRSEH
ncbi:aldehyde dehydrogenase family protein [Rhodococcoides yunnanense]|uniref:aldehyde dehydrogenase family protein n=1 Tax=Rhodococcoides yunnanense TaxID=278209 RepID=UPI000933DBC8|nr:aldehyde dehydrogenase family protein [Rhodococcus yunnanensis]